MEKTLQVKINDEIQKLMNEEEAHAESLTDEVSSVDKNIATWLHSKIAEYLQMEEALVGIPQSRFEWIIEGRIKNTMAELANNDKLYGCLSLAARLEALKEIQKML